MLEPELELPGKGCLQCLRLEATEAPSYPFRALLLAAMNEVNQEEGSTRH